MAVWSVGASWQECNDEIRKQIKDWMHEGTVRMFTGHEGIPKEPYQWGWGRLREVHEGDWIVYINAPWWGHCIAARITSEYKFGDKNSASPHYFDVDTSTVIEFERNDKNVLPTVHLRPRRKFERIYQEEAFRESIENLKNNKIQLEGGETREIHHLKKELASMLSDIVVKIQQMNKSKNLERFLHKVFDKVPNVKNVTLNEVGWGTDHGADLIIDTHIKIAYNIEYPHRVVVQVKSYEGTIESAHAVDQIVGAIEHYEADAGIIATTAESTETIEKEIKEKSDHVGKPIDLLAHEDLARFVINHAPELLF